MQKLKLYLVRHGEVENPKNVLYGALPGFPLNEEGEEQSRYLGKFFAKRDIKYVYSSPIQRTRQTAEIMAEIIGLKVEYSETLVETKQHQVCWGRSFRELEEGKGECGQLWQEYLKHPERVDGGESLDQLSERISQFIRAKIRSHINENFIVVSHGDPIITAILDLRGKPLASFREMKEIKKGSIIEVELENRNYVRDQYYSPEYIRDLLDD